MINLSGVLAKENEIDEAHNYRIQSNKIRNAQIKFAGAALAIYSFHFEEFRNLKESNTVLGIVVKSIRTENFIEQWEQTGARQDISDPLFWCFKLFRREQFSATGFFLFVHAAKKLSPDKVNDIYQYKDDLIEGIKIIRQVEDNFVIHTGKNLADFILFVVKIDARWKNTLSSQTEFLQDIQIKSSTLEYKSAIGSALKEIQ